VALLDPEVVVRADGGAVPVDAWRVVRGAAAVAEQLRTAGGFSRLARFAQPALVNGAAGVVLAPMGRPVAVVAFTVRGGRVVAIDFLVDPQRLRRLDLAVLNN
jgi:hypothetical protein